MQHICNDKITLYKFTIFNKFTFTWTILLQSSLWSSDHLYPAGPFSVAENQGGPGFVAVDQEPAILDSLENQLLLSCTAAIKRT